MITFQIADGAGSGAAFREVTRAELLAIRKSGYSELAGELPRLNAAVEAAIAADEAEANAHMAGPFPSIQGTQPFTPAMRAFQQEGAERVAKVRDLVSQVGGLCASGLAPHSSAPQSLENDARQWRDNWVLLQEKVGGCEECIDVPAWSGPSKDAYDAAVRVQVNALKELSGVLDSTARGCEVGAILNRAVFYAVTRAIVQATNMINTPIWSGGGYYYVRTARARGELEQLLAQIQNAIDGAVAQGSGDVLSGELSDTVTMPNLLIRDRWPSGTHQADVAPADMEDCVTSDGRDVELDVEGSAGMCYAGVNE